MDHHGLRHHDEEHHVDVVTCPSCSRSFEFGKGKPTTCMSCGEDFRPMRSKTSPANQDDMHIRNMPNQGTLGDTGGNSLAEGILKFRNSNYDQECPECGAEDGLEEQEPGRHVCRHCKNQVPKDFSAKDPHGLGELNPYNEKDPESMSTSEVAGWGGGGSRHLKDEGFTASVHHSDMHLDIVEVMEPDSEITESQSEHSLHFPNGITDALHEALSQLNAWVENPMENGKLRPYSDYSSVIRPKINVGKVRVGVEDPFMAEIINHVAQTDDVSALYKDASFNKDAGIMGFLKGIGGAALMGAGALLAPIPVADLATPELEAVGTGLAGEALGADVAGGAGGAISNAVGSIGSWMKNGLSSVGDLAGGAKDFGKRYLMFKGGESMLDPSSDGGSGGNGGQMMTTGPDLLAPSYARVAVYGDQIDTPDSKAPRKDTEDPESVDPHEINDGDNNAINSYDPKINPDGQSRTTIKKRKSSEDFEFASPAIELFIKMLPLIEHYATSDEGGIDDPMMIELHEALEKEFPGYLDSPEVDHEDNIISHLLLSDDMHKEGAAAPMPVPVPPSAPVADPNSASNPVSPNQYKEICPWHGKVKIDPSGCESCSGTTAQAGNMQVGKNPTVKNRTLPDVYDPDRDGPLAPPQQKAAASHQGPHTKEQFIAVAELLEQEGREDEILEMIKNPDEYSEELAKIQGVQSPSEDVSFDAQTSAPPAPPQETPPPNQGMPMPPMGGPATAGGGGPMKANASMLKAAFKYSADNVAGKCPKCKGHTTKMVRQDGTCKCHTCGHTWQDKHFHPSDGDSSNSSTTSSYFSFNDLSHDHGPDLYEESDDHSTNQWKDVDGHDIEIGKEYHVNTNRDAIGDSVLVSDIKDGKLIGTLNASSNNPTEVEYSIDDIADQGLTFEPEGIVDSEETDIGIEQNADGKPLPEAGSDHTDLSTPHQLVSSSVKFAGKHYTPMEQRELIDERGEARNSDKLNLEGTHYIESPLDDSFLFGC